MNDMYPQTLFRKLFYLRECAWTLFQFAQNVLYKDTPEQR